MTGFRFGFCSANLLSKEIIIIPRFYFAKYFYSFSLYFLSVISFFGESIQCLEFLWMRALVVSRVPTRALNWCTVQWCAVQWCAVRRIPRIPSHTFSFPIPDLRSALILDAQHIYNKNYYWLRLIFILMCSVFLSTVQSSVSSVRPNDNSVRHETQLQTSSDSLFGLSLMHSWIILLTQLWRSSEVRT